MHIHRLQLTTFRNISYADLHPQGASIVVLHGANGAGKTSILEGLSLLSPGQGLHKNPLEEHVQQGAKTWGLHTIFSSGSDRDASPSTVGMAWERAKRTVHINDHPAASQTDLTSLGSVQWVTPRMDRLFLDAAQPRREFLDRLVFSRTPEHARTLTRYRHHLKSRLKLLKTGAPSDWIDIEEEAAAPLAVQVAQVRHAYMTHLSPHLKQVTLRLHGSIDTLLQEAEHDADACLQRTKETFRRHRERDALQGTTHFGPQRSDLAGVLHLSSGEDVPLERASTGQHKRAILEILTANARLTHALTGQPPLLLIDEAASHLDAATRAVLLEELTALGAQVWLTGTDADVLDPAGTACRFHVANGQIVS